MRTVSDMKETIQETVDRLDSFQPLFDLYCLALRIRGIPYTRIRMAMIREDAAQLRLFGPGKPRRP